MQDFSTAVCRRELRIPDARRKDKDEAPEILKMRDGREGLILNYRIARALLSEEERERIIKFYHAKPYQFPWIKASDPVSIILGAKPGDILKTSGSSETAGTYVSYSYVI